MTDHDPLCPLAGLTRVVQEMQSSEFCRCELIAKVRADERERIAQAIEAMDRIEDPDDLIFDAARIARGETR